MNNIYLIGPMGAGKTTIGKRLAAKLGLEFYDSDQVIEEQTGATIPWIYDIEGEEGFQKREIKVIAELTKLTGILIATGGGTIDREENRVALVNSGIIIYLTTPLDEQMERVKRSTKRPLPSADQSVARREHLIQLRTKREPLYEKLANITCQTYNKPLHIIIAEIIRKLKKQHNTIHLLQDCTSCK
jgi:shikimate kinase